jgi:predicted RNA-binding protein YlqC (UPF0109 family)
MKSPSTTLDTRAMAAADLSEMLLEMTRRLVTKPADVSVVISSDAEIEGGVVLSVQVDVSDVGMVIGRKGRTADSLRRILQAAARTKHIRAQVIFSQDNGAKGGK